MEALSVLTHIPSCEREEAFADFYQRFQSYPLVVDKYFTLQASACSDDFMHKLNYLRQHTDFNINNPNRVRSLYAAFAWNNPVCFHNVNGSGYNFLTQAIIELDAINPQMAARLTTPFREWGQYTQDRQEKMRACLKQILDTPKLSPDVYEVAQKSLNT